MLTLLTPPFSSLRFEMTLRRLFLTALQLLCCYVLAAPLFLVFGIVPLPETTTAAAFELTLLFFLLDHFESATSGNYYVETTYDAPAIPPPPLLFILISFREIFYTV